MSEIHQEASSLRIDVIRDHVVDPYQSKVEEVYVDTPAEWRQAIGDELWYQYGVFDQAVTRSDIPLDKAGRRHLDYQIELARSVGANFTDPPVRRAVDIGCGWGSALKGLAELFPGCKRIEGVNISPQQLECAREVVTRAGVADRVHLYLCNAKDIDKLPNPEEPLDLAILRGSIIHFSPEVLQQTLQSVHMRMRSGGTLMISESLYKVDLSAYKPHIPDDNDRAACGHRKTPEDLTRALEANGYQILDVRILPSNEDVIHWFDVVRRNIDACELAGRRVAFKDLHDVAVSWSDALRKDKVSVYSFIARRV